VPSSLDVVLVEPYYGGSHRQWADGWVNHSSHDIRLVTHSDEFWRWRMRGGAVTLAEQLRADFAQSGRPDLLVVSDMVDVAALLGLTRDLTGDLPVAVYFHENQLVYPLAPEQEPDETFALINWRSLLAGDSVWFNSDFHRQALLAGLPKQLGRAPDEPHAQLLPRVVERSEVLHVGIDLGTLIDGQRPSRDDPPLVVWNQRWDHDKRPGELFGALAALSDDGVPFRLALAGANSRVDPQEFQRAQERLGDLVVHVGHLPRPEYEQLLLRSDVVVSTAIQEFFGIAVVEAMAAGAVPLLPNRLSYPELLPERFREAALYDGDLLPRLRAVLTDIDAAKTAVAGLRDEMARYDWKHLAPRYDAAAAATVASRC
jgi:glycosyltransferase involved in cell wall biosynthesis